MENQIQAGADVVQIFDSWAAAIEPALYDGILLEIYG